MAQLVINICTTSLTARLPSDCPSDDTKRAKSTSDSLSNSCWVSQVIQSMASK